MGGSSLVGWSWLRCSCCCRRLACTGRAGNCGGIAHNLRIGGEAEGRAYNSVCAAAASPSSRVVLKRMPRLWTEFLRKLVKQFPSTVY